MNYTKVCFLTIAYLLLTHGIFSFSISTPTLQVKPNAQNEDKNNHQNNLARDTISYIFRIKHPDSIKKQPNLRAYYKGYKYDIGNMGIISHQSDANSLFLVITDQVKHKCENDKIQYLERIENNPCRAFFLRPKPLSTKPGNYEWDIIEEDLKNIPLRLPEDALVILLNAALVETLKDNPNEFLEEFKKNLVYDPSKAKRTITYLPELIIKKDVTQSQIDLAAAHAFLCGIDLDAIHVSPKKEIKIYRERIVELTPFERQLS